MAAVKDEAEDYFGVRFPPYKFGQDNRSIVANIEKKEIANSIKAIKGYGGDAATILYECSQQNHESFVDVLSWLSNHSFKVAKYEPLIKIGYFDWFGNIPTLLRISHMFDMFKEGEAKSFSKQKENPFSELMPRFANSANEKGKEYKSWAIHDCWGLIKACELNLYEQNIPDIPLHAKASLQLDILGYIDLTTNNKADRRKLFLTEVVPLNDKKTGTTWGYAVFGRSIGTGKMSRWTVRATKFKHLPIKKSDIIYASSVHQDERSGYWYLDNYTILER